MRLPLVPPFFLVRLGVPFFAFLGLASTAHAQLVFNFIDPGNIQVSAPQAYNGFVQAANRWSGLFTDSVTVNLEIGFQAMSFLGSTSTTDVAFSYTSVRSALISDALTSNDALAIAHLPNAPAFDLMLNYTNNNPNGSGSAVAYLDNDGDANNSTVLMTKANAKALGLRSSTNPDTDGTIRFSSSYAWDFDSSDGVTAGSYDFVGVAAHEIGHALGFFSGVDELDTRSTGTFHDDDYFQYVYPLDLYRRSALSLANGGDTTLEWTAGNSNAYFSLDGGITNLALFSTGRIHGDGRQASHWKDNLGIGLMDPTASLGETLSFTGRDLQAFDVIGWNLSPSASAPEPGALALTLLGAFGLAVTRRVRKAGQ
jgi:Matrixin